MRGQYIQVYTRGLNSRCLIEKCGNGSVIPLDGRFSLGSCIAKGIDFCRANNEIGFRVMLKKSENNMPLWGHLLTDLHRVSPATVES